MIITEVSKNNEKLDKYLDENFKWAKELYWQYKFEISRDGQQYFMHKNFKGRSKDAIFFLTEITKVDNFIIENICKENNIVTKRYNEVDMNDYRSQ